jgi:hypothetical protein
MNFEKNTVVVVDLKSSASNTFLVDRDEGETVLVTHPLSPNIFVRVNKSELNHVAANLKDSTERCIDYANSNKSHLDYNIKVDLECLGIYFGLKRKLTPRQKQLLANICGILANIKLNNDVAQAMVLVSENESLLDEFNLMWFNKYKGIFSGKQSITSQKQRSCILNMAGYVLAQLENPMTNTRK